MLPPSQPGTAEFVYPGLELTDSRQPGATELPPSQPRAAELPPSQPDAAEVPPSQPVHVELEFISLSQLGAPDLSPS